MGGAGSTLMNMKAAAINILFIALLLISAITPAFPQITDTKAVYKGKSIKSWINQTKSMFSKKRVEAIGELERLTFKYALPGLIKDEIDPDYRETYKLFRTITHEPDISPSVYDEIVAAYINATRSKDYATVLRAIMALGISKARGSVPDLMMLLGTSADMKEIIIALGKIGPDSLPALPQIRKEAFSKNGFVRCEAIDAMAEIGRIKVINELTRLASDPDEEVRRHAVIQIGNVYAGEKGPVPDPVFNALLSNLKDNRGSQSGKIYAAYALGKIGPRVREAIPELIKLVKDKDQYRRKGAVIAMGCIAPKDPAVRATLKAMTKDPDPDVSKCVREALQKGDK